MKRRLQTFTATAEQPQGALHAPAQSPYLTATEAVAYLKLRTESALYYHINTNGLPTLRLGNSYRFDRRELDAWLRGSTAIELVRKRG